MSNLASRREFCEPPSCLGKGAAALDFWALNRAPWMVGIWLNSAPAPTRLPIKMPLSTLLTASESSSAFMVAALGLASPDGYLVTRKNSQRALWRQPNFPSAG